MLNQTKRKLIFSIGLIIFVLTSITSIGFANEQIVSLLPQEFLILSGDSAALKLHYNVLSGQKGTTGLTIRIHYNSRLLDSVKLEDLYGEGLLGQDYTAKDDVKDFDNDPLTDKFLCVGWVGMMGKWPRIVSPPLDLGNIVVKAKSGISNGETSINVSASSTPAGYNLITQRSLIFIQ